MANKYAAIAQAKDLNQAGLRAGRGSYLVEVRDPPVKWVTTRKGSTMLIFLGRVVEATPDPDYPSEMTRPGTEIDVSQVCSEEGAPYIKAALLRILGEEPGTPEAANVARILPALLEATETHKPEPGPDGDMVGEDLLVGQRFKLVVATGKADGNSAGKVHPATGRPWNRESIYRA